MQRMFQLSIPVKIVFYSLLCVLFIHPVMAQKAREVLEQGKRIRAGKKLFLEKDGNVLKYDINMELKDPTTLPDSSIFLVEKEEVNIYLKPLNPLSFSYKTTNVVIVDPVSEE